LKASERKGRSYIIGRAILPGGLHRVEIYLTFDLYKLFEPVASRNRLQFCPLSPNAKGKGRAGMAGDAQPIRVLVIEDNPDDQELLHYELKKTAVGKHVLALSDPRVALDLLQGETANEFKRHLVAIFLDVHLPHMSGIDLLKMIRSMAGMETFPVIIMTASPPPETIAACRELKVMALLEKPITFNNFSKAIANIFHNPKTA